MKHIIRMLPVCLIVLLVSSINGAHGAVVVDLFSNFGPSNSFNTTIGWGVSGSSASGGYRAQAQRFTPAVSGNLSTIQIAIGKASGSGLSNISLVADNGGFPTGTLLESFSSVPAAGNFGNSYAPRTLTSVINPLLEAGSTYWLRAEPADLTTSNAWNNNNQGDADRFGYAFSPGAWDALGPGSVPNAGAFRISATLVPEPGPALALCALVGALIVQRRRSAR